MFRARLALLFTAFSLMASGLVAVAAADQPTGPAPRATVVLGADLDGGPAPTMSCSTLRCVVIQVAGGAATTSPTGGTISTVSFRHGPVPGGLATTAVRVLTFTRTGDSYTVRRSSREFELSSTEDHDNITALQDLALRLDPGEFVGLEVSSGWAGDELRWLRQEPDQAIAGYGDAHPSGTRTYRQQDGVLALFRVELTPASNSTTATATPTTTASTTATATVSGGPTTTATASGVPTSSGPTTTSPTSTGSPTGGPAPLECPPASSRASSPASHPVAGSSAAPARGSTPNAAGAGDRGRVRWSRTTFSTADQFDYLQVVLDSRGRPHIAAAGTSHKKVHYFGPSGGRVVDDTVWGTTGVGLAVDRSDVPRVAWSESKYTERAGLLERCTRLHIETGGVQRQTLAAWPEGVEAADHVAIVTDPTTGLTHLAYDEEGRIAVRNNGRQQAVAMQRTAPADRWEMSDPAMIRLAANDGLVLLGYKTYAGRLVVQALRGQTWTTVMTAEDVRDFGVALRGSTPVIAWSAGSPWTLNLREGSRVVRTGWSAGTVALAVDGQRTHVVFSRPDGCATPPGPGAPTCEGRGGILHAEWRNKKLSTPVLLEARGQEASQISVAARAGKVAVVNSNNGAGYLYTRIG